MKKKSILFLVSCSFSALFSAQSAAGEPETPKYTEEQLQKLEAAEEKYKDNPSIMKIITNIKANAGITDTDTEPPPVTAHGKVITQGSHQQAEEAFKNKDNETAIAHYKVLAAEGDPEANLKLGFIYEQQGDSRAAYAAYKKAAESEHNNKDSKMASERLKWLEKDVMSDEEIEQANQSAEESSSTSGNQKQTTGTRTINNTNQRQYKSVIAPEASSQGKPAVYSQSTKPRTVKITPEKVNKQQHFKPEKFIRIPES